VRSRRPFVLGGGLRIKFGSLFRRPSCERFPAGGEVVTDRRRAKFHERIALGVHVRSQRAESLLQLRAVLAHRLLVLARVRVGLPTGFECIVHGLDLGEHGSDRVDVGVFGDDLIDRDDVRARGLHAGLGSFVFARRVSFDTPGMVDQGARLGKAGLDCIERT
jgi:hypothetical protein